MIFLTVYADDTHLTYAGSSVDNIQFYLNQDLENVHNWLRANKLTLNMTKTGVYAHWIKAETE